MTDNGMIMAIMEGTVDMVIRMDMGMDFHIDFVDFVDLPFHSSVFEDSSFRFINEQLRLEDNEDRFKRSLAIANDLFSLISL